MILIKIVLLLVVVFLVYLLFFKKMRVDDKKKGDTSKKPEESVMVPCAHCGVYLSHDEAILSNGKRYCSKECLEHVA